MNARLVVISGCSGGGKSSLLAELAARGHAVVDEPGRRIIAEEKARAGSAPPWIDMGAFLRRAIDMARADWLAATQRKGWVFFDRSLIDAASGLEARVGKPIVQLLGVEYRYHRTMFMVPSWPEIYRHDEDRRHGLDAAEAEYRRLLTAYTVLGYEVVILPRTNIGARADHLLAMLAADR